MAIELILQYPNRVGTPDDDYPYGVPRNRSAPGATDGTPYEQAWYRDQEGFFQGMLFAAGIEPSGNPDTVLESDYLDALTQIASGVTEVDMAGDQNVTLAVGPSRISALKLTGALAADVELIVPDTERFYWIVDETTGGFNVTVKTDTGTGVEIVDSATIVRSNGSDVVYSGSPAQDQTVWNTGEDTTESLISALKLDTKIKTLAIGEGQTWQDVLSSRSADVVYTNTTGRSIYVSITVFNGGDTSTPNFGLVVDGLEVSRFRSSLSLQSNENLDASFGAVVPNGSEYFLEEKVGSTAFAGRWSELR